MEGSQQRLQSIELNCHCARPVAADSSNLYLLNIFFCRSKDSIPKKKQALAPRPAAAAHPSVRKPRDALEHVHSHVRDLREELSEEVMEGVRRDVVGPPRHPLAAQRRRRLGLHAGEGRVQLCHRRRHALLRLLLLLL